MSFGRGGATARSRGARDSCKKVHLVCTLRGCFRLRLGRLGVEQGHGLLAGVLDGWTWTWSMPEVIGEGVLGKRRKKVMGGERRKERKKKRKKKRKEKVKCFGFFGFENLILCLKWKNEILTSFSDNLDRIVYLYQL